LKAVVLVADELTLASWHTLTEFGHRIAMMLWID